MTEQHIVRIERALTGFGESIDRWKVEHDLAMMCHDLEADLALFHSSYHDLSKLDADWHLEVFEGTTPYDAETRERIAGLYHNFVRLGDVFLELIASLGEAGYDVTIPEGFRDNLAEARGVSTSDSAYFDDQRLLSRQDAAIEAYRKGETIEFGEMGD